MTRARDFSQQLGGGGNAAANVTFEAVKPFLTTSNVVELANLYYSNARVYSNIIVASINDLFDVDTKYANGNTNASIGSALVWNGNTWSAGNATLSLSGFTTDNLPEGSNNLYYTNARARTALSPANPTIVIDYALGTIRANIEAVANVANTTDAIQEGFVNLYYSNDRVRSNVIDLLDAQKLGDLYNVVANPGDTYPTGHPNAGNTVYLNQGMSLIYYSAANAWVATAASTVSVADFANVADEANRVLTLSNFTTDDLAQGNNNLYFTNENFANVAANLSIDIFKDVEANLTVSDNGYLLTWNGTCWIGLAPANIANLGVNLSAEHANSANIANYANTAGVANIANVAIIADTANVALFAETANVANVAKELLNSGNLSVFFSETANIANIVLTLSNFTTSNLAEGSNLYYTDARVLANVEQMSVNVFADVDTTNVAPNAVLQWNGSQWVPNVIATTDRVSFAENANVANIVLTLSNFTTDDLLEGSNNLYYTNVRLRYDLPTEIYNQDITLGNLVVSGNLDVQGSRAIFDVDTANIQGKKLYLAYQESAPVLAEGAGLYVGQDLGFVKFTELNGRGWYLSNTTTFGGNLIPDVSGKYSLGTPTKRWRDLYLGSQSLYVGDTIISESAGGGLTVLDSGGNVKPISSEILFVSNSVQVDSNGFIGANVLQSHPNLYIGAKVDNDLDNFVGMRVQEISDPENGQRRGDLQFYTYLSTVSDSNAALQLLGYNRGIIFNTANGIAINGINFIDSNTNFIGNSYLGTQAIAINKGGTGADLANNAVRNLVDHINYGFLTKVSNGYVQGKGFSTGVGVIITNSDGREDSPISISIGQDVATNASVTFKELTVTDNVLLFGNVVTYGANNLVISDNMIYMNKGANTSLGSRLNPDLGISWAYNDGIYQHGGFFRDASDNGNIKFYQSYTLEPDDNIFIDTSDSSFKLANVVASKFIGTVIGTVSSLSNHTTDSLNEGSNLYYTNARVNAWVQPYLTTANVIESASNLYYTNARVNAFIQPFLTTANVVETGNNLYLTNTRVIDALVNANVYLGNVIAQGGFYGNVLQIRGINVSDSALAGTVQANVVSTEAITANTANIAFATLSNTLVANSVTSNLWVNLYTANVIETASNLYFTNARVVNALIAGNYISIEANGRISANLIAGDNISIEANGRISSTGNGAGGVTSADLTTANVIESASNLYYTNARVNAFVQPFLTTANVIESASNLYYTNARVLAVIAASNVTAGNLIVTGDLQVQGNAVYLNAATLVIEDKNIVIANGAPNAAAADGAGFTIEGANANIQYSNSGDKISVNKNFEVTGNLTIGTGSGSNISGVNVLTADTIVANVWTSIYTANVIESASNLYYTNTRVNAWVQPWLTTANVKESSANLYYTNARVNAWVQPFLTTGNVTETSGNLYFTNARVVGALIAGENITIEANGRISANTSNISSTITATITATSTNNTTNVSNSNVAVLVFSTSTYRTAKFVYTAIQTAGGSEFAAGEMLLMHNTNSIFATQYGMLTSSNDDLVTLDTDINNGNVRVLARTSSNSTIVTVKLTGITYTSV